MLDNKPLIKKLIQNHLNEEEQPSGWLDNNFSIITSFFEENLDEKQKTLFINELEQLELELSDQPIEKNQDIIKKLGIKKCDLTLYSVSEYIRYLLSVLVLPFPNLKNLSYCYAHEDIRFLDEGIFDCFADATRENIQKLNTELNDLKKMVSGLNVYRQDAIIITFLSAANYIHPKPHKILDLLIYITEKSLEQAMTKQEITRLIDQLLEEKIT